MNSQRPSNIETRKDKLNRFVNPLSIHYTPYPKKSERDEFKYASFDDYFNTTFVAIKSHTSSDSKKHVEQKHERVIYKPRF